MPFCLILNTELTYEVFKAYLSDNSFDSVVFMYLEYFLLVSVFIDILRYCIVTLKCMSSLFTVFSEFDCDD